METPSNDGHIQDNHHCQHVAYLNRPLNPHTLQSLYGECPIKLFDGNQTLFEYHEVPLNERLKHITSPDVFVYDEAGQLLYRARRGQFIYVQGYPR